jgi:hypothetical protein
MQFVGQKQVAVKLPCLQLQRQQQLVCSSGEQQQLVWNANLQQQQRLFTCSSSEMPESSASPAVSEAPSSLR